MFDKRWYIAALLTIGLASIVACEADEFEDAPTVRAPERSEARSVEPRDQRPQPARDRQARNQQAQNLPADHPPIERSNTEGDSQAAAGEGRPAASPDSVGKTGPLRWQAPEQWRAVRPASNMRLAEYHLPAADGAEPATLTVFYFGKGGGGSIQDNIDRWVGQFDKTDAEPEQSTRTVNGLKVHLVDASGTFNAGSMMGGGQPKADWRMRAAIVETPAGNFFFKLTGPAQTVASHDEGFESFLSSFEAAAAQD